MGLKNIGESKITKKISQIGLKNTKVYIVEINLTITRPTGFTSPQSQNNKLREKQTKIRPEETAQTTSRKNKNRKRQNTLNIFKTNENTKIG